MIGQTLSHFRITAKLGEGGMGEVYRAEDTSLDREVAIKVLPEAVTGEPERLARFEREAKVLAALNHPNIAGIHQITEVNGKRLLVIEDVVTSGGQVVISTGELRERGAIIEKALCVIDREAGGGERLAENGIALTPLFNMTELKASASAE